MPSRAFRVYPALLKSRLARVLDLGCGAGLDSILIASSAGSVVGIDFSTSMLAVARSSAESMGLANVEFREGDAESIPVEGSVDVVLVNGIFNLNPERSAIFKELARVTSPDGVVFAAELVLKGHPPVASESSESDWFS